MTNDMIADLKQFITATVSQQGVELREDIAELHTEIAGVNQRIDDLSAAVADAIDTANEHNERWLNDHEVRISRLEQFVA